MSIQSWFSSKPYWLKGGIIGGIISIILSVIFVPCVIIIEGVGDTVCLFPLWLGFVLYSLIINNFPFLYIDGNIGFSGPINIFNFFIFLSLGTAVGWLFGKIKH